MHEECKDDNPSLPSSHVMYIHDVHVYMLVFVPVLSIQSSHVLEWDTETSKQAPGVICVKTLKVGREEEGLSGEVKSFQGSAWKDP